MASAERTDAHDGQQGQSNKCASDRNVVSLVAEGLATHATAGALVTLSYASCFWSAFFGGVREAQERSAKERP